MQSELNKNINIDGYTLKDYLGAGQFGEVWLAHDTKGGNDVAIKFYVSLDERGRKEFFDEYKLASTLQQDNLLRVSHLGEYSRRPYMVMDYCEKGPASNLVGTLAPNDEEVIWRFIHDVAAGLRHLHANNIVHQDIKPDNILQTSDGRFVIADFGISTNVRATMRKQSGRINNAGSVAYMPPEKFKSDSQIIKAGDIWALGVSIYELAVGKLPFAGQGGVMQLNGAEMPEIVSKGYSKELNTVMQKCLQKETWDRFSAESLMDFPKIMSLDEEIKGAEEDRVRIEEEKRKERETIINTKPTIQRSDNLLGETKPPTPSPSSKTPLIIALLLLLIGGVIGGIVIHNNQKEREQRERDSIAKVEAAKAAEEKRRQDSIVKAEETKKNNTVQPISGTDSGHSYVDLGLPSGTLWATTNVGADNPWDYGDYFAWGETTTKSTYSWSNYKHGNGSDSDVSKKYNKNDGRTTLERIDDVAYQNWGSDWCMPTQTQFQELKNKCTWTWTTLNGKKGYNVRGANGKSIFLPAAGWKDSDGKTSHAVFDGYYWSSSLYTDDPVDACYLCFYSGNAKDHWNKRYRGRSVRPVRCR